MTISHPEGSLLERANNAPDADWEGMRSLPQWVEDHPVLTIVGIGIGSVVLGGVLAIISGGFAAISSWFR